jgi:electron transfer flavoprotein beta subunit
MPDLIRYPENSWIPASAGMTCQGDCETVNSGGRCWMKVVVCCKAVPVDIKPELVQAVNGEIRTGANELFINEADEYALEAALALKKDYNAEVWAVTVGSLMSQEALYMALAKGVENVLRIDGETGRPEKIAEKLVKTLGEMKPDIVLTGIQSQDWMGGEVGVYVGAGLGMPVGYAVVDIVEVHETSIRVVKEIGGGRKAEVVLALPAVLCVQTGIKTLQYVSAMKRRKVKGTPIDTQYGEADEAGFDRVQISRVFPTEAGTYAEVITGERIEKIQKVLAIIRKNV